MPCVIHPRKKVPPETPEEVTKKLKEQRDYWDKQVGFCAASEYGPESSIKVQPLEHFVRPAMAKTKTRRKSLAKLKVE